jgi:hypothetical protein
VTLGMGLALTNLGLARRKDDDRHVMELTARGVAFYDAWHVYGDRDTATDLLREAFLELPVTQALMQGLHGRGSVPVEGALNLMARYELADPSDPTQFRTLLQALNDVDVIAYSKKQQTVRIVEPMPEQEAPEEQPSLRIVEPDRPYQNVRHLRETLRACKDYIWWADMHFEKRAFEPLGDEADATKVKEIRILSSGRPEAGTIKDYERFKKEMATLGITVEWRTIPPPDREWHDRYIITRGKAWNVPPVGAIFTGKYSEFTPTAAPPFKDWWQKGAAVS